MNEFNEEKFKSVGTSGVTYTILAIRYYYQSHHSKILSHCENNHQSIWKQRKYQD